MMGKSTHHYAGIDRFLRRNLQAIFDRSTKGDKNIFFVGRYRADLFRFGKASKCPSDVIEGPYPKEIECDKVDFDQIAIDDECLFDLTDRICNSTFWTDLAKITKGRRRRKRTGPVHEDLWYLRRAEDVLQMYDDVMEREHPRWFRRTGPLAIDFYENAFYHRRDKLAKLKSLVMNKPVSVLQGDSATGKTVLALHLAYELCNAPKRIVYYFDCDRDRDFDKSRLLSDIRSVKDVIIVENVHLAVDKFQQVYSAFKYDKKKHILLTSRSSLQLHQDSKSEDLTEVPTLYLEPFEDADGLIDEFLHSHPESPLSLEFRQQIKDVSSDSLWLLAYALVGYVETNGRGEPKSWILAGVRKDLQDLENICVDYPEALTAVAALYRDELLMAERYLVNNLSFSTAILNDLVRRGELVRQETSTGHILYGLPHTALASAYWECCSKYKIRRNFREYEAFIHEYVSSAPPNGLEVLTQTHKDIRDRVMVRLETDGKLVGVISNEQSTAAIDSWLVCARKASIAKDDVLTILARKIEQHDCALYVPEMLRYLCFQGEEIWKPFCSKLDCEKLVKRMANTNGMVWAGIAIFENQKYDEPMMRNLYSCINFEDFVQELNQTDDVWTVGRCISAVYRIDPEADTKLSKFLDWRNLAAKLSGLALLQSAEWCIHDIWSANKDAARLLCDLLCLEELAECLNRTHNVHISQMVRYISMICRANPPKGLELWHVLDKKKLATKFCKSNYVGSVGKCIDAIYTLDRVEARKFCSLITTEELAKRLYRFEDPWEIIDCIYSVLRANPDKGLELWQSIDKKHLAAKLSSADYIWMLELCLNRIFSLQPNVARELCGSLNVNRLASTLLRKRKGYYTEGCLKVTEKVDPQIYQALRRLLNKKGKL
jgi:hypothetical protein